MKDAVDDTVNDTLSIRTLVIPAFNNLWHSPLDDLRSDLTSRLVEHIAEVILGDHGVRRVGGAVIMEDNKLLLSAVVDDLRRACAELSLDLLDDRKDEWSDETKDEDVQLLLELLEELRQDWDLVDGLSDLTHEIVVELDDWVDLSAKVLGLTSELLRILW